MSKKFTNLDDLEKYIQKKINDVLLDQVSDAIKDELQFNVDNVVYSAGAPSQYIRRNLKNGSLGDKKTMNSSLLSDGTLKISPNANFNHLFANTRGYGEVDLTKSLAFNIEYGYGSKSHWYNAPRPFVQETVNKLKDNKAHVEVLKTGLEDIFGKNNVI